MSDRKKTIYETIKSNPYAKLPTISIEIKQLTGKGVAMPALMKLRDAVANSSYDSVYRQLFESATATTPVKRGPGRPRKSVPHVSAPIHQGEVPPLNFESAPAKRGPGRPRKEVAPVQARQAKSRGDRRAKFETRGRRDADLNKVQLNDFSEHLVVYRTDGVLDQQTFKSRDRAESLVRELLNAGHAATEIAYYKLNPIKTTVTVTI